MQSCSAGVLGTVYDFVTVNKNTSLRGACRRPASKAQTGRYFEMSSSSSSSTSMVSMSEDGDGVFNAFTRAELMDLIYVAVSRKETIHTIGESAKDA